MMTRKQKSPGARIVEYLRKCKTPKTPTEIGEGCGYDYDRASSWACRHLKKLVKFKIVRRRKVNGRSAYELIRP